ncbi:hypothetical protein LCGC14_1801710 [marine sediment metagenome]|uniref:Uncharacterized protein n=1 Tax=marine sediment metagenome TaxID=412755 RepID=A0A0F9GPF9_9ZZZZ
MKKILWNASILFCLFYIGQCSFGAFGTDIKRIRMEASPVWESQGFKVLAYEGWNYDLTPWPGYGGAHVWFRLQKIPDNGITYSGSLVEWGDEIHVYGPRAHDAIRP